MGKSKHEKPLTHEQIWDDSALVRSWEDAVEEYQLYHSIHAKGENIEDVLREAEESGVPEKDQDGGDHKEADAEDVTMEVEIADSNVSVTDAKASVDKSIAEDPQQSTKEESTPTAAQGPKIPAGAMPMPEPILAQVQDEKLKNLMMAWYYAGYYTGLYEGQQQANQSK